MPFQEFYKENGLLTRFCTKQKRAVKPFFNFKKTVSPDFWPFNSLVC